MKNLFVILLMMAMSITVNAQKKMVKIEMPVTKTVTKVQTVIGEITVLKSGYQLETNKLVPGWEYVVWLTVVGCHQCETKQAVLVDYELTTFQVQRNQSEKAEKIKKRTIDKKSKND